MNPANLAITRPIISSWLKQYVVAGDAINPVGGRVITDTGPLEPGNYDVVFHGSWSVSITLNQLIFDWRNAANTGYINFWQIMNAGAGVYSIAINNIKVAINERFRVSSPVGYTGSVHGSIVAIRRTVL